MARLRPARHDLRRTDRGRSGASNRPAGPIAEPTRSWNESAVQRHDARRWHQRARWPGAAGGGSDRSPEKLLSAWCGVQRPSCPHIPNDALIEPAAPALADPDAPDALRVGLLRPRWASSTLSKATL